MLRKQVITGIPRLGDGLMSAPHRRALSGALGCKLDHSDGAVGRSLLTRMSATQFLDSSATGDATDTVSAQPLYQSEVSPFSAKGDVPRLASSGLTPSPLPVLAGRRHAAPVPSGATKLSPGSGGGPPGGARAARAAVAGCE